MTFTVSEELIKMLARKTAIAGLKRKDAVNYFDVLYAGDAIKIAQGDKTQAGRILGINRSAVRKIMRRAEGYKPEKDEDNAITNES